MITIEAINCKKRLALRSDGLTTPITDFLDRDGDPCDVEDARYAVTGQDGLGWAKIDLNDFETQRTQ